MSEMAVTGKWIRITLLALLATILAGGQVGWTAERMFAESMGFEPIPTPDPAYREIPWDNEIAGDFLAEDMARAMAQHGGMTLDGSTYSEDPIGPCDFLGKGICCPPTWYSEQQIRVFTRNRPRFRNLSEEFLPDLTPAGEPAVTAARLNTKSITFDGTEGYYTTIGRHLFRDSDNRDHFGEFTYWGFHSWDDWTRVSGRRISPFPGIESGSLFSPFDRTVNLVDTSVGGFNFADTHLFSYQSSIHNWELNSRIRHRIRKDRLVLHPNGRWRREERPGPYYSFLYGIRVINVNERSLFSSRGRIIDPGGPFAISGDYHVRAGNNLVGLQIGGDMIYRFNKWSWGFRGKTAAMINSAHHISTVESAGFGVLPNFRMSDSSSTVAAVIEFGATGKYMITPHFWLTGSYDLMWLTGLALAPEQMNFEPRPLEKVRVGGTIFYHGLTAGVEWTF